MSSPEPIDLRSRRRIFTADEIERVAIKLFTARGFADVTVDEIAVAAGISPRTFFRYFPTKAHVVLAHQRRLADRLVRALTARPADEGPVTALREAFLATTAMRAEEREETLRLGRLLSSASVEIVGDAGFEPDQADQLVALVAERAALDPTADLEPSVVVAAMAGAARAAFRAWVESGGRRELTAMMSDALQLVTTGLGRLDQSNVQGTPSTRRRGR
jgi:AcrR family transcriptional regulator